MGVSFANYNQKTNRLWRFSLIGNGEWMLCSVLIPNTFYIYDIDHLALARDFGGVDKGQKEQIFDGEEDEWVTEKTKRR